jgi:hypothetical protein
MKQGAVMLAAVETMTKTDAVGLARRHKVLTPIKYIRVHLCAADPH